MMTTAELQIEWDIEYRQSLGMMCGTAEPTPEQDEAASLRATEHTMALMME